MRSERAALAVALGCLLAAPMRADLRLWSAGLVVDPRLQAPVVDYVAERSEVRRLRFGVAALTFTAELERLRPDERSWFVSAETTPLHATFGNEIFVAGDRDRSLEFEARSFELRAGVRISRGEHWSGELRALGLYLPVSDVEPELEKRWRNPYAGVGGSFTYRRVRAEELVSGRIEGVELTGAARGLFGEQDFAHLLLDLRAGQRRGRAAFGERLTLLHGTGLDRVNAFLAGGSWDAAGAGTLYGFRYAEFRLEQRAALLLLRADLSLRGGWSIGLRSSALTSPGLGAAGAGVVVERQAHGITASAGAFVAGQRDAPGCCDPMLAFSFGSAIFAAAPPAP